MTDGGLPRQMSRHVGGRLDNDEALSVRESVVIQSVDLGGSSG